MKKIFFSPIRGFAGLLALTVLLNTGICHTDLVAEAAVVAETPSSSLVQIQTELQSASEPGFQMQTLAASQKECCSRYGSAIAKMVTFNKRQVQQVKQSFLPGILLLIRLDNTVSESRATRVSSTKAQSHTLFILGSVLKKE